MKFTISAVFLAFLGIAAAAPISDPGDTAPVMANGGKPVPFANTGKPGNAMDQ